MILRRCASIGWIRCINWEKGGMMCGAVSNRRKSSGGRAPRPFACFSGDSGVFASYCFCVFEDAAGYGKDGNRNFADICTVVLRWRMVLRKTHGAKKISVGAACRCTVFPFAACDVRNERTVTAVGTSAESDCICAVCGRRHVRGNGGIMMRSKNYPFHFQSNML